MKRMSSGKRVVAFGLLASCLVLPAIWPDESIAAAKEKTRLALGASATGTWFYMFCAAMGPMWNRDIPEVDVSVMATAGSNANYQPLNQGDLHFAVGSNIGNYWASQGLYFAKTKLTNFAVMAPLSRNFKHAFTYAESPMKTWKDQEGKNILIGPKASAAQVLTEEVMKALGMNARYLYATTEESIEMMKDRRADGMIYDVAAPWSSILDVATQRSIKFLSMTPEQQKRTHDVLPYAIPDAIPTKTYAFQKEDARTISTFGCFIVNAQLSDDVVYRLTKVLWQRWGELEKGMESLKWVKPRNVLDMNGPIHAGAAKYYREVGVQVPEQMIWKKK